MVKKKKFWKNIFRHLKSEYSRFLSMIGIVLLGVGVITGLLVTTPNMQTTISDYYKNNNTADIFIKSTVGFNDESINIIKENNNDINSIAGMNISEEKVYSHGSKLTSLIYETDLENNNFNINMLTLIKGRFPKADKKEVVVEQKDHYLEDFALNDIIEMKETSINTITGEITTINVDYKVVGIVSNPWYFSKEAEKTVLSSEKIQAIIYKQITNSKPVIYSDIFITLKYESNNHTFTEEYHEDTKKVRKSLETLKDEIILDQKSYRKTLIDNNPFLTPEQKTNEKLIIDNTAADMFVLTRKANISFQTFDEFVLKVDSIAKIFPIFFLLVAALVVLTTMTRLVEEERLQIGLIRALGYSKRDIYMKYILYALIIGVIGTGLGYLAGFRLLPVVIYNAFDLVFFLPPLNLNVFSLLNIIAMVIMILSILLATILAVNKTLKQNCASLLLPRAPKKGKRILLERIPFIWKRLKFKYKSSLRNIFRYPKHLLMTVLGVAGSLALVFTGFGLNNAIKAITDTQFNEIYKYDLRINISKLDNELISYLDDNHGDYLAYMEKGFYLTSFDEKDTFYVDVVVFEECEQINEFIKLRNRKSKEKLTLNDQGVIISEQISRYLKLNVNDSFSIDGQDQSLKVEGVTENYINSKIYMTKVYYDEVYGKDINNDSLFRVNKVITNNVNNKDEETLKVAILENSQALGVDFQTDELEANKRLLDQINIIVVILVGAAGMLAIIVVYNLANVNISERQKEIATLKVLGYKQSEVSGYIFREIIIMTLFGIIAGIGLGYLMHFYIINSIDTPNVMMGRNLEWYTFVISIGLTLLFTFIVQFLMYFKIKKIDMIEAMKEI